MEEKNKEVKEEKKTKATTQSQKPEKKQEIKDTKKEEKTTAEKKEQFKKVDVKKADDKKAKMEKGDKKAKNKDKKETKKSWIMPTIVTIVVIAIVAALTFMIVISSDPKKSVDGLMTNLKAGDFEKAQEFMNSTDEDTELVDDSLSDEAKTLLFEKLSWKVTNVTENGDEADVEIEITNKNYKNIITKVMQKALKAAFSGEEMTEAKSQNYLIDELKSEQVEMTTATNTLKVVKVDNKWKVEENDELIDAVLPGLQESINSLGN